MDILQTNEIGNTSMLQMTPELQIIFTNISRDSNYSSSDLLKFYYQNDSSFRIDCDQCFNHWKELETQVAKLRKEYLDKNNLEFFKIIVMQHATRIIERIKEEYSSILTPQALQRLNNFNLELTYDEEFKHDITAYTEQNKISINMAYFAQNKPLEKQIVQAMGTMPHEIFHFIIKMLKDPNLVDEKMIYELSNGETASNLGMVGHILNEGFVEKISSDFCRRNNIFYTISPSYIQFVNLCNYIMSSIDLVTESYIMHHNYEDILRLFSFDVRETYKQVEREEYANKFELKLQDGKYRKVEHSEIVRSFNQIVKMDDYEIISVPKNL